MKHIAPGTVELTDDEARLKREQEALADQGFSPIEATARLINAMPIDGPDWNLLTNLRFLDYLNGHTCREQDLVFQGTMGAPGIGNSYKCPFCTMEWVNVGNIWYVPEEADNTEPPWVLTLEDVK